VGYIPVTFETEPIDLAEDAFGYLESQIPGWLPSPGNLEAWLIEALALLAGELRALAALVPEAIFEYFGSTIMGLPPYAATSASATTTWTAMDNAGYRVDAGTLLALTPPASLEGFAFQTVDTFTIPQGTTVITGVGIRAVQPGVAASGLTGTVQALDPLDFISSITLEGATAGGTDAEDIDAYLDRLSDLLTLMAPRPILPADFALMVQRMIPGVARATAIDLYNASTGQTNQPRCVTVVVVGPDGNAVPAQTLADADALLQSEREVNFLAFVINPTYTSIDVTYAATCFPGFDPTDVRTRVNAELTNYLSPANWGVPPFGDTGTRSWINDTYVRWLEVAVVINNVDGVNYVTSLTIGPHGGTMGTTDVLMTGIGPLPRAGTITGTVSPTP